MHLLLIIILFYIFMFIFVMLSSDLNVKKSGPGIIMSPQNKGRLKLSIEIFNTLY